MRTDKRALLALTLLLLTASLACNTEPGVTLPQAYVAPMTVNVRAQLNQKNSTIAVLKHGDRVGIVDVRRRYVRIRTGKGAEGWVDSFDLLRPQDMERVNRERAQAQALPVEAYATAYESLNIHLDPSRTSPAFAQIAEGGAVSILARKVVVKASTANRSPVVFEKPKLTVREKRRKVVNTRRPPMPAPPKVPADWATIWGSGERSESEEPAADLPPAKGKLGQSAKFAAPPIMEAWTLVRTKSQETGWVLSRNLMMSIPDDVAQYAEGKHITSYFDLGTINDEERGPKHNWLWTTISGAEAFDFDSWRVFLWNRHRHRYETSYRMRKVEGYFPVRVDNGASTSVARTFHLITKDEDGQYRERTYNFDGARVHLAGMEDYPPAGAAQRDAAQDKKKDAGSSGSWLQRGWTALKQRLSGSR